MDNLRLSLKLKPSAYSFRRFLQSYFHKSMTLQQTRQVSVGLITGKQLV